MGRTYGAACRRTDVEPRPTGARMSRTSAVRLIIALLFAFGLPGVASAEVSEVKIATQYGIGYLPLTIMKHNKLIEKSLAQAGLGDTKVSWVKLGAGAAANDALLSD